VTQKNKLTTFTKKSIDWLVFAEEAGFNDDAGADL
jgi:hypothetical protein